jgi:hypothetical protein
MFHGTQKLPILTPFAELNKELVGIRPLGLFKKVCDIASCPDHSYQNQHLGHIMT